MAKLPAPTEAEEAKVLVAYLRIKNCRFHHSPNETGSSLEARRRAVRMKQQGTAPGYPDYTIIVNNQLIFIELKRVKNSSVSQYQTEWLEALNAIGYPAYICYGAAAAIQVVQKYLTSQVIIKEPATVF